MANVLKEKRGQMRMISVYFIPRQATTFALFFNRDMQDARRSMILGFSAQKA